MPYTVLVVEAMKSSITAALEKLKVAYPNLGEPRIVLLTTTPEKGAHYVSKGVQVIGCDFSDEDIRHAFTQIASPIKAVICRGDSYVQQLRKLVPHLPANVHVSSAAALEAATDKRRMREIWNQVCPEITPRYARIGDPRQSIAEVVATLHFPVIIKPANLASSLLIQKCDDQESLRRGLEDTWSRIQDIYTQEERAQVPELLVEEYLEGNFYSIDSYVVAPEEVYHTPLVAYTPAKKLGVDDFFIYKRITPVDLPTDEVEAAQHAASRAIQALGLQYSSVHVELVRTTDGWKIIEVGPRLGRFRSTMYREAFGIDHAYNDVLVHLGIAPELTPTSSPAFCATYSIYPMREGELKRIDGLADVKEHIQHIVLFFDMSMAAIGKRVYYAKHGGHALCQITFTAASKEQLENECTWLEAHVKAVTMPESKA